VMNAYIILYVSHGDLYGKKSKKSNLARLLVVVPRLPPNWNSDSILPEPCWDTARQIWRNGIAMRRIENRKNWQENGKTFRRWRVKF